MQVKIYDELPLEAKKIREDVFVKEQGFNEEFDIIDKTAKHILISENNIPVATCRIFYSKERNSWTACLSDSELVPLAACTVSSFILEIIL